MGTTAPAGDCVTAWTGSDSSETAARGGGAARERRRGSVGAEAEYWKVLLWLVGIHIFQKPKSVCGYVCCMTHARGKR